MSQHAQSAGSAQAVTAQVLAAMPLFAGEDPERLLPLVADCPVRELQADEVLLEPGQHNDGLFVLLSGALRVHVGAADGERLSTLEAGACVGELSMLEGAPATAFVIADGPSRVLAIDSARYWALVGAAPLVARNLMRILAQRIRANTDLIAQELELKRANGIIREQQAELARHAESLEQTVHERTAELEASRGQLAQQQRELQQAYLEIERNNRQLEQRLTGRRWLRRSGFGAFALILLALGLHFGLGLDLQDVEPAALFDIETQEPAALPDQARSVAVSSREVEDWLRLRGTVQPTRWLEVTAPLGSLVQAVHFQYGDLVERGQLLLELDTTEQRVKQREATTRVLKATQEVERLQNWSRGQEVNRARRDLDQANDALKEAQRSLENSRRLFEKGIISGAELRQDEAAVADRELAVVSSKESLQSVLEQGSEVNLRVAQFELENARYALEKIESELEQAQVRSPGTGIIFPSSQELTAKTAGDAPLFAGSPVAVNQVMFAIADMHGIALESQVSEDELLKLAIGQPAKVLLPALPGTTLEGRIDSIAGRAVSDTRGDVSFKVRAVVEALDPEQRRRVRIGMSAEARVLTYHNADALVVPFEAVSVEGGRYHAQVLQPDGGVERRRIEVRGTLVDGVEVAEGLSAGERVLMAGS